MKRPHENVFEMPLMRIDRAVADQHKQGVVVEARQLLDDRHALLVNEAANKKEYATVVWKTKRLAGSARGRLVAKLE